MADVEYEPYEVWLAGHAARKHWTEQNALLAQRLIAVLARARLLDDPVLAELFSLLDKASAGA